MGAYLLILVAAMSRVVPHPWMNFTAVGGGLLCFGAKRPLRETVWPVAALMATDYFLTVFAYHYAFHVTDYVVTWAWYAGAVVLGRVLLSRQVNVTRVIAAPVLAATSFFVLSNFAVWAASVLYPHTLAGLGACYVAALPFYGNDLLSTTLVTGLAFGLPMLAKKMAEQRRLAA